MADALKPRGAAAARGEAAPSPLATLEQLLRQQAGLKDLEGTLQRMRSLVQDMAVYGTDKEGPMREIPARLGDKWSSLILLLLRVGTFRHSTLQRIIAVIGAEKNISQRMLTLRLRALERDGLLERHATDTHPPGVEYALSDLGRGLLGEFDRLFSWIQSHREQILQARERFGVYDEASERDDDPEGEAD